MLRIFKSAYAPQSRDKYSKILDDEILYTALIWHSAE